MMQEGPCVLCLTGTRPVLLGLFLHLCRRAGRAADCRSARDAASPFSEHWQRSHTPLRPIALEGTRCPSCAARCGPAVSNQLELNLEVPKLA